MTLKYQCSYVLKVLNYLFVIYGLMLHILILRQIYTGGTVKEQEVISKTF